MSDDIKDISFLPDQLRADASAWEEIDNPRPSKSWIHATVRNLRAAADEIERLRADLAEVVDGLERLHAMRRHPDE